MKTTKRFVLDTNTVVSAFLFPDSSVAKAFDKGLKTGTILLSEETLEELQEALLRAVPKIKFFFTAKAQRRKEKNVNEL